MDKKPYTAEEQAINDHLVEAWSLFLKLEKSSQLRNEFGAGINKCQDIMGHLVLCRDYPAVFRKPMDKGKSCGGCK